MGDSQRSRSFGTTIFFISMVALLFLIADYQPEVAIWIPTSMILGGMVAFIAATISYGRYRDIFDYEPTTLLGRNTKGKGVRSILRKIVFISGWIILMGGLLSIFI